jgi:hypothetical protein
VSSSRLPPLTAIPIKHGSTINLRQPNRRRGYREERRARRDSVARDSSKGRASCNRHHPRRFDLDLGVQANVKRIEDFHSTFKRNPEILIALITRYLGLMDV